MELIQSINQFPDDGGFELWRATDVLWTAAEVLWVTTRELSVTTGELWVTTGESSSSSWLCF